MLPASIVASIKAAVVEDFVAPPSLMFSPDFGSAAKKVPCKSRCRCGLMFSKAKQGWFIWFRRIHGAIVSVGVVDVFGDDIVGDSDEC